jgi:16S rRNA G966 N2-methylase RsmD
MPEKNRLYYGDNLDVLRRYIKDESVDLIYLDPPFNSRQDYNVLFAEKDGTRSSSQIMAFEDKLRKKGQPRSGETTFSPARKRWVSDPCIFPSRL